MGTLLLLLKIYIEEIDVIEQNIEEEIVHGSDLEYLDKESYVEILKKRGMVNKDGEKNENHPGFALTPVRLTRSKARLLKDKEPLLKNLELVESNVRNVREPTKLRERLVTISVSTIRSYLYSIINKRC